MTQYQLERRTTPEGPELVIRTTDEGRRTYVVGRPRSYQNHWEIFRATSWFTVDPAKNPTQAIDQLIERSRSSEPLGRWHKPVRTGIEELERFGSSYEERLASDRGIRREEWVYFVLLIAAKVGVLAAYYPLQWLTLPVSGLPGYPLSENWVMDIFRSAPIILVAFWWPASMVPDSVRSLVKRQ